MKAKDAVAEVQNWKGSDRDKVDMLYHLYCKEFADRIKIRYRGNKCALDALLSIAKEMDLWVLALRDRGKFTWIGDSAGKVLFGFMKWTIRDLRKYIEQGIQINNSLAVVDIRKKIQEAQAKINPHEVESDYKLDKKILTYFTIGHLVTEQEFNRGVNNDDMANIIAKKTMAIITSVLLKEKAEGK